MLHEADEATAPHRAVALYGLPVTDPTDSQFPETCRSAVWQRPTLRRLSTAQSSATGSFVEPSEFYVVDPDRGTLFFGPLPS